MSVGKPAFPMILPEDLLRLERDLSDLTYSEVPVVSTLGDVFRSAFLRGGRQWGWASGVLSNARAARNYWRGLPRLSNGEGLREPGRILVTWASTKFHNRGLVLPVLNALGPERCNVIGPENDMADYLSRETGYVTWGAAEQVVSWKEWRVTYSRVAWEWRRRLRDGFGQYGIPSSAFSFLMNAILVQSQRIFAYGGLLDAIRPAAVLTDYDRHIRHSCLILAAKARRIPTMTQIHGVINPPYGYVPLLADLAFCWGEQHRDQMMALGTKPDQLVITGCPRLNPGLDAEKCSSREKAGLSPTTPVVMLATNPPSPETRGLLVSAFCRAIQMTEGISGLVRLHPSETIQSYSAEAATFPDIRFSENEKMTVDEALAASDVVVCRDSGFGNDAIYKGKLTIVMDMDDRPVGNGATLVEKAGCPYVRTSEELSTVLKRLFSDSEFHAELRKRAEEYAPYYCFDFGARAANRIAEEVVSRINLNRSVST